jgi:hypothetical protein
MRSNILRENLYNLKAQIYKLTINAVKPKQQEEEVRRHLQPAAGRRGTALWVSATIASLVKLI